MKKDTGLDLQGLRVDGGAVQNNFLMQFQADILQSNISKPKIGEITGLGAVFLAGLAVGFWKDKEELKTILTTDKTFKPQRDEKTVTHDYKGWKKQYKEVWLGRSNKYPVLIVILRLDRRIHLRPII